MYYYILYYMMIIFRWFSGDWCHSGGLTGQLQLLLGTGHLHWCAHTVPLTHSHIMSDCYRLLAHILPLIHFNGHHSRQNYVCKFIINFLFLSSAAAKKKKQNQNRLNSWNPWVNVRHLVTIIGTIAHCQLIGLKCFVFFLKLN